MGQITLQLLKKLKSMGIETECKKGHAYQIIHEDEWLFRICKECLVREPLSVMEMEKVRVMEGLPVAGPLYAVFNHHQAPLFSMLETEATQAGVTPSELMFSILRAYITRLNENRQAARRRKMVSLYQNGMNPEAIGKLMNIKKPAVIDILKKEKAYKPRKYKQRKTSNV